MCGKFNNIFILLKLGWFKMLLLHTTHIVPKTLIKKNFCHTKNNRRYIFTLSPHMNQLTEKERNLQKYKVFHAWHKGCPMSLHIYFHLKSNDVLIKFGYAHYFKLLNSAKSNPFYICNLKIHYTIFYYLTQSL